MLCWRYRAHLKWNGRVALLAAALLLAGICGQQWRLVMPLALPYLVLYLAARLPFQKMERWGDYSYGIYIFSFPIQQLLYFHGLHRLGFAAYLAASLILSLAAGILSWWLVEKPALRLGRKLAAWDFRSSNRFWDRRAPLPVAVQLSLPMESTNSPAA
jgi:peptidoglycan/LPS O-acetylase OafA/YrhL